MPIHTHMTRNPPHRPPRGLLIRDKRAAEVVGRICNGWCYHFEASMRLVDRSQQVARLYWKLQWIAPTLAGEAES